MILFAKNTLIDLFKFLKNPVDRLDPKQKLDFKLKRFFTVLLFALLINFLISIVFPLLIPFFDIAIYNHKGKDMFYNFSSFNYIFLGALIIPIIEELVFRSLLRFKHNYVVKFILFTSCLTGNERIAKEVSLQDKFRKGYKIFFYFIAFLFAFIHLLNFQILTYVDVFKYSIFVFPQFLTGLLLGYLRVKYGFVWGVCLHCFFNLFFLSMVMLSSSIEEKSIKIDVSNNLYELQIEEVSFGEKHTTYPKFEKDTLYLKNVKFKKLFSLLFNVNEKCIKFNSKEISNKKINLNFKKHIDTIQSKQVILEEIEKAYSLVTLKTKKKLKKYGY